MYFRGDQCFLMFLPTWYDEMYIKKTSQLDQQLDHFISTLPNEPLLLNYFHPGGELVLPV